MSPPIPSLVLSIGLLKILFQNTKNISDGNVIVLVKFSLTGIRLIFFFSIFNDSAHCLLGGIVSDKLVVILCFSGCVMSLLPALYGCFEDVLFISSF